MKFICNPLKTCILRTAGLSTVNGARFGMTRKYPNGKPRPHQGIDLATDEGYRVYAVEDGEIVATAKGYDMCRQNAGNASNAGKRRRETGE